MTVGVLVDLAWMVVDPGEIPVGPALVAAVLLDMAIRILYQASWEGHLVEDTCWMEEAVNHVPRKVAVAVAGFHIAHAAIPCTPNVVP